MREWRGVVELLAPKLFLGDGFTDAARVGTHHLGIDDQRAADYPIERRRRALERLALGILVTRADLTARVQVGAVLDAAVIPPDAIHVGRAQELLEILQCGSRLRR